MSANKLVQTRIDGATNEEEATVLPAWAVHAGEAEKAGKAGKALNQRVLPDTVQAVA